MTHHHYIKTTCLLTIILLTNILTSSAKETTKLKFAILSDIHIFDNSLLIKEGKAFENNLEHDRKMLKESREIADEAIKQIIIEHPDYVLISGDLTKDGELKSHQYVVEHILKTLLDNGIQPLVVPGNHDVNNPNAAIFNGDSLTRTTTISQRQFAEIYADFGYKNAIARDPSSLSYVYQLSDSVRLLALDACRYYDNDFEKDFCLWHGKLKESTINFAIEQLRDAKTKNIKVIGIMHHGIIEHWKYQNIMLPGYVVDNYEYIAKQFAKNGLRIMFTGHAHTLDASKKKWGHHTLTDVQTGSLVSYPIPYRTATLTNNNLAIKTHFISQIPSMDNSIINYSAQLLTSIATSMIYDIFPETFNDNIKQQVCPQLASYFVKYTLGNEKFTTDEIQNIKQTTKTIRPYSLKWSIIFNRASKALLSDSEPNDHTLNIEL